MTKDEDFKKIMDKDTFFEGAAARTGLKPRSLITMYYNGFLSKKHHEVFNECIEKRLEDEKKIREINVNYIEGLT